MMRRLNSFSASGGGNLNKSFLKIQMPLPYAMHRFCFIFKWSDFKRISKYDFKKGMHSFVSNDGFNRNTSKRARLNEKPGFLYHLKKPEVRPILEVTISFPEASLPLFRGTGLRLVSTWCIPYHSVFRT